MQKRKRYVFCDRTKAVKVFGKEGKSVEQASELL